MIGTLDVECQAKNPNLPLAPMTAFINSPSSLRIRNVPKRIGDWCIRNVYVTCVYPDSSIKSVQCVLVGGIWVGTIQGTTTSGTSKNGYTIFADGTDENGNNVTGYILGKGDIEILEADGTLSPDPIRYYVKLLSAEATQPREGDMYPTDEGYVIWQDGQANLLGTPFEQIAYVDSAISSKADLSAIHGDYIEDASGNKIEADRTVTYVNDYASWQMEQFYTETYDPPVTMPFQTIVMDGEQMNCWITPTEVLIPPNMSLSYVAINEDMTKIYLLTKEGDAYHDDGDIGITEKSDVEITNTDQISVLFTRTVLEHDELALKSDLPTKTSDLTNDSGFITSSDIPTIPSKTSDLSNDSGFITSAEIEPYHDILTPTVNTGVAKQAMSIALSDNSNHLKPNSILVANVKTNRDLTDEFTAAMQYATYYPYYLEKYFEQTFSPALELKFCNDRIAFMAGSRPRTIYTGYMFRTGGAGFAMPCSEDGTPDGRLYETTDVTNIAAIIADQTTSLHQLTFTSRYDDPYGQVATVDGQSEQMTCWRINAFKAYTIWEELANKSDLPTKISELSNDSGFITSADVPTKTSDLSNDSGFITSADIITKRDLFDFNVYVDPMADINTTKFTVVVSYAASPSTPLFTVELTHQGGEATTWAWIPFGINQRISIDYYSNDGSYRLSYLNLQDGGGTEHSGSMTTPLTSPYWTGEAQDDWFHFSVTSQTTTITTKAYVDSLIAALEARISALENS